MKLKSITIKNFKGIDEEGVTIDFAPITLLFGPNNAGKSTIIQALHLAREVFCEPKPDLNHMEKYGKGFNLGSFKDYVHKHEVNRTVSIKLDFDDVTIPNTSYGMQNSELFDNMPTVDDIIPDITSLGMEINLSWDFDNRKPILSRYEVYLNNSIFTQIELNSNGNKDGVSVYNYTCNPYMFISEKTHSQINEISSQLKELKRKSTKKTTLENELYDLTFDSIPPILRQFIDINYLLPVLGKNKENPINFTFSYDVVNRDFPVWGEYINFTFSNASDLGELEEFYDGFTVNCNETFSRIISVTGKIVGDELNKLLYIGPMREIPARGPLLPQRITYERWATGLAAWDKLLEADEDNLTKFNKKLETLSLPYSIEVRTKHDTAEIRNLVNFNLLTTTPAALEQTMGDYTKSLAQNLASALNDKNTLLRLQNYQAGIYTSLQVYLKNNKTNTLTEPHDMGLGVSQIIPFIVAMEFAQKNAFIAIEQPELHIHPKLQVNLGDIIIESAKSDKNPLFLIETHSEHLLLRLLRRMRNTNEGTAPDNLRLTPEDIAVNWIGPTAPDEVEVEKTRQTYATRLELDEDGSFNTPWPEGFFAERREELYG